MYILFSFRNWSKSDPRDFRGCTHRQIRGRAEGAKFRPIAHELVDGATFLSLHPFQSNSQVLATGISLDRVSHISPRDSNPITAESILPFSSLRRIRSLHNFLPRSLSIFSQLTRRLSYTNAPREFRYLETPLRDRLCTLVQRFPIPQSETLQLNVACYLLLE